MVEERYVILCMERNMWWTPGAWGYTPFYDQAGSFPKDEAERIIASANICGVRVQLELDTRPQV